MAQTRKQKVLQEVMRQRRRRTIASIVIVAGLVSIIGVGVYALSQQKGNSGFPFPCLGFEGTTLHVHPWLRIMINTGAGNSNVSIPVAIGILNPQLTTQGGIQVASGGSCFEPLHTHDASGIIHLESGSTSTIYTLGDFFEIWRVTYNTVNFAGADRPIVFNQTDILGFTSGGGHEVKLLVDGQQSNQYRSLALNNLDYCSKITTGPPCYPTAPAGDPQGVDPSDTGHTILIQYT